MTCPACGFENPANFRFCGGCGAPLAPVRVESAQAEAELRQITVVFCDVVGSTALSARLAPEELREVVRSYQRAATAVIERYGGHVAQYLGDGILSYFGYPVAYGDDARRAVHAGLEVVEAVRRTAPESRSELSLSVRVGIHTGPVVAGEMGGGERREKLALGFTPNLAARLQGFAQPNEVVVSGVTLRLTGGSVESESCGLQMLPGIDEPLEVFRITRSIGVRAASERAVEGNLAPGVGREAELAALMRAFGAAAESNGRTMVISGEAGIGKSRLVRMLRERLSSVDHTWLLGRCSPYDETSPWSPFVYLFERMFDFRSEGDPVGRLRRIEDALRPIDVSLERSVPVYAGWLGVPYDDPYERLELAPQREREILVDTLVQTVLSLTKDRPVVLVVEDVHWADPSSIELLQRFEQVAPDTPLLVVLTSRPTADAPWAGHRQVTRLQLERLQSTDATALVAGIAGDRLPVEVAERIVEQAGGVPLFVEELTRAVVDSGRLEEQGGRLVLKGSLDDMAIPATLQESLAARLDRLGGTRRIAQLASVFGREFDWKLVTEVAGEEEATLRVALEELLASGLVLRQREGQGDGETYVFRHALVREAAYESLLRSNRKMLHRRVAEVLAKDPAIADGRPDLLGRHYAESGLVEPSVRAWVRAAELGMSRWASAEAIEHCRKALATLEGLPAGEDRDALEIAVQTALGQALIAAKGYAAAEVEATYARAVELCKGKGDSIQHFWMLWGLGGYYMVRGDLTLPIRFQMLRMAQTLGDSTIDVEGHFAHGTIEFYLGHLDIACRDLNRAYELDSPGRTEPRNLVIGVDGGITATSFGAMANWLAGELAVAEAHASECEALGRRLNHSYSYAFALVHTAFYHQMRRSTAEVVSRGTEALGIAQEKGFVLFLPMCGFLLGWAQTFQETDPEVGLGMMRQSIDGWRGGGALIWQTYYLGHLADRHIALGKVDEAERLLDEALEAAEETLERFWEAELRRLKGLVAETRGDRAAAAAAYRTAVEIASSRGVRALELRALVSLTRLLNSEGRPLDDASRLGDLLLRFDREPAPPDVLEARALLGLTA